MFHQNIVLPKKIKVIQEDGPKGIYEIEGLYPGYGHTLGNALRRIILSSLPGVSIVEVKIKGADHEFSALSGIREDVLTIILNLKKVRFSIVGDDEVKIKLHAKGKKVVSANDFEDLGEVTVTTPDQYIAEITDPKGELEIELTLAKGIGFVPKEDFAERNVPIGTILVDAVFSPIRKVKYEVENMRVGDRTDYNLLRLHIETDGSLSAKEALESALRIMIAQFQAILDMKLEEEHAYEEDEFSSPAYQEELDAEEEMDDEKVELFKTRVDTLDFSPRTEKALTRANIRTLGGIVQKTEAELLALDGFGKKSLEEVREMLATFKLSLKE